jgi:hypothetical protein
MLANLRALFGVFVDIMLLRRGPEHLPASPVLLGGVIVVNLALYSLAYGAFLAPLRNEPSTTWTMQIVVGALLTLLWFRIAFHFARKPERFVQTMIAVFATNTLAIPAVPLVAAMLPYAQKQGGEPAPTSLVLLTSLVGLWVLAVLVRIVRSAFEWSWAASIVFVVTSNLGVALLLGLLFGDPQKAS